MEITLLVIVVLFVCFIALCWFSKQSNQGNTTSGLGLFLWFFFIAVVILFFFGNKIFAFLGV